MEHNLDINRNQFPSGSVVYYLKSTKDKPWIPYVWFGLVEENYTHTVCLQLLEIKERRLINGIPFNEFESPTRWQKLPKGWTYDTKLFEQTWEEIPEKYRDFKINDPDKILEAFHDGYLVRAQDIDHRRIHENIDSHNGWRLEKQSELWVPEPPSYISLNFHDCYATFDEAQAEVDRRLKKLQEQSKMTDHNWAIHDMEKTLNWWKQSSGVSDDDVEYVRQFLLSLDDFDNIETRVWQGLVQWKYFNKTRWASIELPPRY